MLNRDVRTLDTVSSESLESLRDRTVVVVGAGGLGGYVIEMLARFGVGHLRIIDGDVFDESNLNRQLLSREDNLGKSKVIEAKERVASVRSDVAVTVIDSRFTEDNASEVLKGADVVMDCVDNVEARFVMAETCSDLNIPMIHGAVGAWNGQVMTLMPGDDHLRKLYGDRNRKMSLIGAASFIPANIASVQVAECIKLLTGQGSLLKDTLKVIDLLDNESYVVSMKS